MLTANPSHENIIPRVMALLRYVLLRAPFADKETVLSPKNSAFSTISDFPSEGNIAHNTANLTKGQAHYHHLP